MIESEGEEVGIRYVPSLGVSGGLEMVFCEMQILCVVQVRVSFPWWLVDGCWLFNFLSSIKRTKSGIYTSTLREVYIAQLVSWMYVVQFAGLFGRNGLVSLGKFTREPRFLVFFNLGLSLIDRNINVSTSRGEVKIRAAGHSFVRCACYCYTMS